ncbi:MAG: glycosyltransferase [Roseovarius sp.]|nr:glycosyltransferase [Roseovarius sp.]
MLLITLGVALAIVASRRWLLRRMRDRQDSTAVQASHVGDSLRLGGVAIFAGLVAGLLAGGRDGSWMPVLVVVSTGPAVLAGLLEDLGYGVPARRRLAAAFMSAALAVLLLGTWVTRADLPGLDRVLAYAPLAVPLTLLLSAAFCHATNLVDGMNGLAATVMISASVGLWMLAREAGLADVTFLAAVLGAAMAGFFVLNWPFGTVFMGDAGSCGVGHVMIWSAILLAARAGDRDAGDRGRGVGR